MKRNYFKGIPKKFVIAVICIFLPTSAFAIRRYTIIDLGTEGVRSHAYGINDFGQVVGYSSTGTNIHAVMWENASRTDIWDGSTAYGINDLGQVVGYSSTGTSKHPFFWENGTLTELDGDAKAWRINNSQQIVGWSEGHPTLWENGGKIYLSEESGFASDINNSGQVVGEIEVVVDLNIERHPFLWENGAMTDLGTFGGFWSKAYGINDFGQVVGFSSTGTSNHAFLWENGSLIDIGADAIAFEINNSGQVVGWSNSAHALIWENYTMYDLNDLIPWDSGWELEYARDINEIGQIVGIGTINGEQHGFLLTPVPEITIDAILEFFDESVEQGTLVGRGKRPRLANLRLKWMRKMIGKAGDFIERGRIRAACRMLQNAYKCCDGKRWPPDFVKGTAVPELASKIQNLRNIQGCN